MGEIGREEWAGEGGVKRIGPGAVGGEEDAVYLLAAGGGGGEVNEVGMHANPGCGKAGGNGAGKGVVCPGACVSGAASHVVESTRDGVEEGMIGCDDECGCDVFAARVAAD